MKIFGLLTLLLAFGLSFSACSNELDLTAPWKDVPIVYGMLSTTDSAQYIRVERAFLDPEKNALNFTKNPDSIYYANATVSLINLENNEKFDLTKVDGNTEGYVRDTGIWAQAPNYLYKIKSDVINLVEGNQYQLVINKGDNLPVTKVETQIVGLPEVTLPTMTQKIAFSEHPFNLNWRKAVGAELYDVDVIFNYDESLESDPSQFGHKSVKWKALIGITPSDKNTQIENHSFQGSEFYRWLGGALPKKNVIRHATSIGFVVTAGGIELQKYFEVSQANFGITGSETTTEYTNIPDGYGVFSSLAKARIDSLVISPKTLDSLENSIFTAGLNFK